MKGGKDERIAGVNPLQQDKFNQDVNLELGLPKNHFASHVFMVIGGGIKERINYDTDGKS